MSNDSDISRDQPSQLESTANSSRDTLLIESYSDESSSQMSKETEMRNALRDKLHIRTTMSTEEKRNKKPSEI